MMIADLRPHHVAPYFYGGIPDYSALFSCDTAYAVPGAVGGGFRETAKGTLLCLAKWARLQSGRVPHQVNTQGTAVIASGNSQETQQYVVACGRYLDWTGDVDFIRDNYDLFKKNLEWVARHLIREDEIYPAGYGIMEVEGANGKNIDAACYLFQAFSAMVSIADGLGELEDARGYRRQAEELRVSINADFWNAAAGMWADALTKDGQEMSGMWGVCIPQETKAADPDKARAALRTIGSQWKNTWHLNQPPNSDFLTCPYQNGILAGGAYNYCDGELGWSRIQLTAKAVMEYGVLGGFENVVPTADDLPLIESPALLVQNVIEGLCGISPVAVRHHVDIFPQPPAGMEKLRLDALTVGGHRMNLSWTKESDGALRISVSHIDGPEPLHATLRVKSGHGEAWELDGVEVHPEHEDMRGTATELVHITLRPAQSAVLRVVKLQSHSIRAFSSP